MRGDGALGPRSCLVTGQDLAGQVGWSATTTGRDHHTHSGPRVRTPTPLPPSGDCRIPSILFVYMPWRRYITWALASRRHRAQTPQLLLQGRQTKARASSDSKHGTAATGWPRDGDIIDLDPAVHPSPADFRAGPRFVTDRVGETNPASIGRWVGPLLDPGSRRPTKIRSSGTWWISSQRSSSRSLRSAGWTHRIG